MSITITVRKDGPYLISRDDAARVRLVGTDGNAVALADGSLVLCRCGCSASKPFCDATHARIGFRGTEAAREAFDAGAAKPE